MSGEGVLLDSMIVIDHLSGIEKAKQVFEENPQLSYWRFRPRRPPAL